MFQTLIDNPNATFASFVFLTFIIFIILLVISKNRISNATAKDEKPSQTWRNIEITSYVFIILCAIIFMIYACGNSSFNCFFIFSAFN
jgi:uncharacterized membrane protein